MNCPRQDNEATMAVQKEHQVHVEIRKGYKCCSYCGSLLSEELFPLIEAGAEIDPTDKSYKIYVHVPNKEAGKSRVIGSASHKPEYGNWEQVTEELIAENPDLAKDLKLGEWVIIAPDEAVTQMKFYFQHLSEAEMRRFIELHNAHKIKMGYPGHFYVRPYFCRPVEKK
jgi:hypothetical protein